MARAARRLGLALVAVAGALVVWAGPLAGSTVALPAFVAADLGQRDVAPVVRADQAVVRSRYITIDFEALPDRWPPGALSREPTLPLELFPDMSIVAVFDRYDPNPAGVTWVGHVDRVPRSSVTLVYRDGVMVGNVVMPTGVFSIRPAPPVVQAAAGLLGRVVHEVAEIDQAALPPEAPPVEVTLSPAELAAAADAVMTDTADVIDVMVLYTPTAQFVLGGAAGIGNLIQLGVSEANTSFANSGIAQRIRLVHSQQVSYVEVSAFGTNLGNLRNGSAGLAGVAGLRDQYGADLVVLLVHPASPSACGIAYVMTTVSTAFAPNGYSVVDTGCVANATFAHELGHNMGAQHDWYVSAALRPYPYAHGYADPSPGQRWRTVMSYNDVCTAQGVSCARTLHWSNPDRTYVPWCAAFDCSKLEFWYFPGAPMGVPEGTNTSCQTRDLFNYRCDADNRRTLNNTALTVANFRQTGGAP